MALPDIIEEPSRQTKAVQSITDMLGAYNKQKQGENLAEMLGIPKQNRSQFAALPEEWQKTYATMFQKESAAKQKNLQGATKFIEGELKSRGETYRNEKDFENIRKGYVDLINKGYTPNDAFDEVFSGIKGAKPKEEEGKGTQFSDLLGISGGLTEPSKTQKGPGFKNREERVDPYGLASTFKQHPGKTITGAATDAFVSPVEQIIDLLSLGGYGRGVGQLTGQEASPTPLTDFLHKQTGVSELPPEHQENIGLAGLVAGTTPINKMINWLAKPFGAAAEAGTAAKAARPRPPVVKPQITGAAPKELTHQPKGITAQPKAPPPSPPGWTEKPTQMRMERIPAEARIYPRLENIELRESQLKSHPKYVQEIETDAAERAERAEKRIPKTAKGMQSKQLRIHEAEKAYPVALESYTKSATRVRALEDEVAKLKGAQRESAETLLELAKKDLDDASFNLKEAWKNLKGTNYRATVHEMRDAAHKKILDLQDTIANGEEYEISGYDYSPKMIEKANKIRKLKPLPMSRESDFYTEVHDVYMDAYKKRIGEIDKQIAELAKDKGMASLAHRQQLGKEKAILNKMIQSAEAEKVIQNRRWGLREMAERHKAQERFKQLQKAQGQPKVSQVAKEKMWKSRIQEVFKSPEAIPTIAHDTIEEIAAANPKDAAKIRAEEPKLNEVLEEVHEFWKQRESQAPPNVKGEKVEFGKGGNKKPPPPPKEGTPPPEGEAPKEPTHKAKTPPPPPGKGKIWAAKFNHRMNQFRTLVENMLKKVPILGETPGGRDLIIGIVSGIWDEMRSEYEFLTLTGGQVASLLYRKGGRTNRYAVNQITRFLINRAKAQVAKYAQRHHKEDLFNMFGPKLRKEALESA